MIVEDYLGLSKELRDRADSSGVDVVDTDGNILPRCPGCLYVVCGWSPDYDAGMVKAPSGVLYCSECAAERQLGRPLEGSP